MVCVVAKEIDVRGKAVRQMQSSERRASGEVRGRSALKSADEIQHRLGNDAAIESIMHGSQLGAARWAD